MLWDTDQQPVLDYLVNQASVLFMVLDRHGIIRQVNRFGSLLLGPDTPGKPFQDILIDFHHAFLLDSAVSCSDTVHLLDFVTLSGNTQTYHCFFYSTTEQILVFGHLDVEELESLSSELLSVNQELNNLTRELNKKNRELARANEKILALSRTDHLTGLVNRGYFSERIEQMISLAVRKSHPLSLIITDIDQFKIINDTFGHDAGDRVLQGFAELMQTSTRAEDLVARFGGEEFIILLPCTETHEAHAYAERIRLALPEKDLLRNGHPVSASFGVSQLLPNEKSAGLIKRADTALYRAKTSGRNRTVIATGNDTQLSNWQ
ncbi:GGDEF domain-containing protein [Desulfobulbus alkaliphilus]|uniref:GGDEF domain-containing protein n=1 Tax=Desulfobulbus alkaliphilus TaxID=869814 RepID=UPI0019655A49|nr:GGDEF domain-containing protein [Desulfobulbus alkaliphilus]MBM9537819.1 GGDEF domain-containing protein [Desulfobulbus alkaliphilus]